MYINADVIIKWAALLGAVMTIGGVVFGVFKWFMNQKKLKKQVEQLAQTHKDDTDAIEEELCMLSYVLLAVLDGLKQLNCNGKVTEAHDRLSKHLNKQAHDRL